MNYCSFEQADIPCRYLDNVSFTRGQPSNLFEEFLCKDLILNVFSTLNFQDLLTVSEVNKKIQVLANDPLLLKNVIYRDKAFNPEDWAFYFGDQINESLAREKALKSLPGNIGEIFKSQCSLYPEKKLGETHVLVWIPAGVSVKSFEELLNKKFSKRMDSYQNIKSEFVARCVFKETRKSEWVAMSRRAIPGSSGQTFDTHQQIIKSLDVGNFKSCTVPTALEATICISTIFFKSGIKLFEDRFTRCQVDVEANFKEHQLMVGFGLTGLKVIDFFGLCTKFAYIGLVVLRRFE